MGGDYLEYQPLVAGRGCSLADIRFKVTLLSCFNMCITVRFGPSKHIIGVVIHMEL